MFHSGSARDAGVAEKYLRAVSSGKELKRNFICSICQLSYTQSGLLFRHLERYHKGLYEEELIKPEFVKQEPESEEFNAEEDKAKFFQLFNSNALLEAADNVDIEDIIG